MITKPLEKYDLDYTKKYWIGDRLSLIPYEDMCHYRHRCTNYDELVELLDRDSFVDSILYEAIRARTHNLVEEELEELYMADDECDEA
jgi:hypothetical protein